MATTLNLIDTIALAFHIMSGRLVGRRECGRMSHEDGGDLLWLSTRAWINMY